MSLKSQSMMWPSEISFLKSKEQLEFMDLSNELQSLFTKAPGTTSLARHRIKLTSDQPVRSRPYPVPCSLRESLKKDITDMMKMGVIRKSSSPYAPPVVVVKKKDNTNRVCVDYRRLNKLTVFDPEPMPTAEHLFQKLNGDKYFTSFDLSKGYWQISSLRTQTYFRLSLVPPKICYFRRRQATAGNTSASTG